MENENKPMQIPYIVYESTVDRYERKEKRNSILTLILTIALILSIIGHGLWIYMWNQYDYVDEIETSTIHIDGKDGNAIYQDGEGNTLENGID